MVVFPIERSIRYEKFGHIAFRTPIALIVSCSSVYDVGYDYDQETNFAGLKTYDWLPVPEGIKVDTLVQERIKNAVNSGLEAKGLRMTSDDA